jgi:heme-degrading monooxygenase HmoA
MLRAMLYMKVKPGQGEAFERAWQEVAAQVRNAPGNIRQALLRDLNDPTSFVVTTDWASREAFHHFEHSAEQHELTATLREIRESVRMSLYELVAHVAADE